MVSSIILDTTGSSKIVLKLWKPFLKEDSLHWSGYKDCFIDKCTRLPKCDSKTSTPPFKNFENIPSEPLALNSALFCITAIISYWIIAKFVQWNQQFFH